MKQQTTSQNLIQEYNPQWEDDFRSIEKVLEKAIGNSRVTIEHVGSTAVPGLAAKAIIDIDVIFPADVSFAGLCNKLEKIGYLHNGDQGIPDREAFKRDKTKSAQKVLDSIVHHLYLCPANSKELKRHLLFRDYLRNDATAREEYAKLKFEIAAAAGQDRKEYAILKETLASDFIAKVIVKAEMQ